MRVVTVSGWIALAIGLISLDVTSGQIIGRPIDVAVVLIMGLVISGRFSLALALAITAGLWRSSVSPLPWVAYPLAYLAVGIITSFFLRRIVAERSVASLVAACIIGSLTFPVTLIAVGGVFHVLRPNDLHVVIAPWLISGVMQTVLQPILIWWWWKIRSGGHFARLSSSLQPF